MPKNELVRQKGSVHLITLLAVLTIIVAVGLLIISKGLTQNPITEIARKFQKPSVEPKTTYTNPFEADTQYVNPFSQYKNPFDTLE